MAQLYQLKSRFTISESPVKTAVPSLITRSKESKWLQALHQEAQEKKAKLNADEAARQMRLEELFQESELSGHEEERMDKLAAGDSVDRFMRKLDRHLDVEKALLR